MKTNNVDKHKNFGHKRQSGISKINLNSLKKIEFTEGEILQSKFDIIMRTKDLEYALLLGQFNRKRVLIIFKGANGVYKIINRVSDLRNEKLYFNSQISIPSSCIIKIIFISDGN